MTHQRTQSWGETGKPPSLSDRLGVWLSAKQIERTIGPMGGKDVADVGCGFNATFSSTLIPTVRSLHLADLAISPALKAQPTVTAYEGRLPEVLDRVGDASLDRIICNNVLEHLWEPESVVRHFRRMLRPGGACFVNVPSWRGRIFLETSAFRLGTTAKSEIDDHKRYYERRDLWELMVRGGFLPSELKVRSHKFGLNTYAVARVEG
ncbi:MAG: class I SAM-dependent methyltransferase [Polyangiaceae bacterium]|nr:class I SAM-dependent methyltransferase [Polyangiaceae bacterium]